MDNSISDLLSNSAGDLNDGFTFGTTTMHLTNSTEVQNFRRNYVLVRMPNPLFLLISIPLASLCYLKDILLDMEDSSAQNGFEQESKWDALYKESLQVLDEKVLLCGTVVHGFKRGSKELGIPTANISMDDLGELGQSFKTGVYFGYAHLHGIVYRAVLSVGWNPHFGNTQKSVEVHLLASLDDFYGDRIQVLVCGFLRDEQPFSSLGTIPLFLHLIHYF